MHQLLILEFVGTSELMVVLVVALIIFGPRKLPELGRSLGQAMHQVRSASADFKRTWETEALLETARGGALAPAASAEHTAATEARHELVTRDEVGETRAPAHEAQSPDGLPYVNREVALSKA